MATTTQPTIGEKPNFQIPSPNFDLIRIGGPAGQIELEQVLRTIVTAFNEYVRTHP